MRARLYIGRWVMSRASKATAPLSGVTMPRIMRKVVVLPAPLRPSRPTISSLGQHEADFINDASAVVTLDELCGFQQVHADSSCAVDNARRTGVRQFRYEARKIKSHQQLWISRGQQQFRTREHEGLSLLLEVMNPFFLWKLLESMLPHFNGRGSVDKSVDGDRSAGICGTANILRF